MISTNNLIYGGGFVGGASTITAGKPLVDGNIDIRHPQISKKTREQISWLNANETDIPAIVSALTAKTIGVSVSIQVESKSKLFNQQAEELIEEHGKIGVGELSGKFHFNASCRRISDFTALHGGIIIRHHYNKKWKIPYKYELVGVDMIDISKTVVSYSNNSSETTINGIVRNKWGEITHLYLYSDHKKTKSTKVPYTDLTYYHEVWLNVDQQVAISKLTSMLSKLDKTTQYENSELMSAIEESKAGHYIKSSAYNELMRVVAEEIAKVTTGSGRDRIQGVKDLVTPILRDLSNLGIKARGLTPIASGDEVQFNNTKRDSQYKDMNSNSEMKTSASQGLSDIGTYNKAADANYSSIKYTLETDQRTADIRFDDHKNAIYDEINKRIIQVGIQIGRITERVAYWKSPNLFNKFRYLRQNKIDTEPAKNALANEKNIQLGIDTEADIIERTKGIKYEDFLEKKHQQALKALQYEIDLEMARKKAYEKAGIEIPNPENKPNEDKSAMFNNMVAKEI